MAAPTPNLTFPAKVIVQVPMDEATTSEIKAVNAASILSLFVAITPKVVAPSLWVANDLRIAMPNDASAVETVLRINTYFVSEARSLMPPILFSSFPVPYTGSSLVSTRPIKGTQWPRLANYGSLQEP